MWQRIQTFYMAVAFITAAVFPFKLALWKQNGVMVYAYDNAFFITLFTGSVLLSVMSIFAYKKRIRQFILNRFNILLNLLLFVIFAYKIYSEAIQEKRFGIALPLFALIFLVLANKAIKKDEDLVRSMDRIR